MPGLVTYTEGCTQVAWHTVNVPIARHKFTGWGCWNESAHN